jgi:arsenite methyltransferase
MASQEIVDQVRDRYAAVAESSLSNDQTGVRAVAEAFGYSPEDLAALPAEANMGLSCGNPTATAHLKGGEVVLDLGCGGGIDVLLAAKKVGPTGKAIGIDMTPAMIARATANAAKAGLSNVEFHLANMESLPVPDATVDCLISNCVINLVPDKPDVFREMFRVLKPGGRVAVSDIALKRSLPPEIGQDIMAYVGCIAGAILIPDYERLLREAGFEAVQIIDSKKDLNVYAQVEGAACCGGPNDSCCGPSPAKANGEPISEPLHDSLARLLSTYDVNDYAASVQVFAIKSAIATTSQAVAESKETSMTTLQVFDKPMCCSTGICGPSVDTSLIKFAADLAWLNDQGVQVERYNLAQQPQAFVAHDDVKAVLKETHALPVVRVNGHIVSKGVYPSRQLLAGWCGVSTAVPLATAEVQACGPTGCC